MGAVKSSGKPNRDYCENTASWYKNPWFSKCCKWEHNRCLPKTPADGNHRLYSVVKHFNIYYNFDVDCFNPYFNKFIFL